MLSIYTTENILSAIYEDGEDKYTAWFSLIEKIRPKLNVLFNKNSTYETDNSNPVFELENSFNLEIIPEYEDDNKECILTKVLSLSPNVILDPCAIVLMDIDKKTADKISEKYKIICHSFNENPETSPLFTEAIEKNLTKDEKNSGWHELIFKDIINPSNSLIFIDRYLFSQDKSDKTCCTTSEDGLNNIFEILNLALPFSCNVDFHILFIFDGSTLEKGQTFIDLSTNLNKLKNRLGRTYNILLEVLSISKNDFDYKEDSHYSDTHNRRILSNYYFIRAEHSLKAFRNSRSLYTQSIWFDWACSKGILQQKRSDLPAKSLYRTIKNIRKAILKLKSYNRDIPFSQNGNSKIKIKNITNRIITS